MSDNKLKQDIKFLLLIQFKIKPTGTYMYISILMLYIVFDQFHFLSFHNTSDQSIIQLTLVITSLKYKGGIFATYKLQHHTD